MKSTGNLDEVSYLYRKGIIYSDIRRFDDTKAIFLFDRDIDKELSPFRQGKVVANIQAFMYTRNVIKQMIKTYPIEDRRMTYMSWQGKPYWYIVNKTIMNAVSGVGDIHRERWNAGNFYVTKEEAESNLVR